MHSLPRVQVRVLVYERALKHLPACYKIWHDYLIFRRQKVRAGCAGARATWLIAAADL